MDVASITPLSVRSARVRQPAAWMPSTATATAERILITISAFPAGQCLVNCPFGAIADKSQIFQMIRAIQAGERVYAAVAPAFVGQFGPKMTPASCVPR